MTDTPKSEGPGRPTGYKKTYAKQAEVACGLGATDEDLADLFDVSIRTIYRWRSKYKEFRQALRVGKEAPDDAVERALYQRAVGYSHPDTDIRVIDGQVVKTDIVKYYPPDTKAALAWLYNRRTDNWHPQPEAAASNDLADILANLIKTLPQ